MKYLSFLLALMVVGCKQNTKWNRATDTAYQRRLAYINKQEDSTHPFVWYMLGLPHKVTMTGNKYSHISPSIEELGWECIDTQHVGDTTYKWFQLKYSVIAHNYGVQFFSQDSATFTGCYSRKPKTK
jgi:hypothetical protein